jgi:hypothetical protein
MPSATFTTGEGYFNWTTNQSLLIDTDYAKIIDYDDETRWDFSTYMAMKGQQKEVQSPEFIAWAGELNPRTVAISNTTAVTAGDTVFYLASTSGIRVDDVLHFPTAAAVGEHVRVTAIGSGAVTVLRMNTAAGTLATAAGGVINGAASSTLASASIGDSWMEPAAVTNRCQLIRRAFAVSRVEADTATRVNMDRVEMKADQARMDYQIDRALTMWFSVTKADSTNTYLSSKGVNEQLAGDSAVTKVNAGGELAYSDPADCIEAVAAFAKTKRYYLFHGSKVLGGLAILAAGSGHYRTDSGTKTFGTAAQMFQVSDFEIVCKYERLFDVVGAPYNGYGFLLDLETTTLHYLQNNKHEYAYGIQTEYKGSEVIKGQYRCVIGLGITWPKRNALIYGVT